MRLLTKCPVCKKKRLYIRKWRYTDQSLPTGALTTDGELCKPCHQKIKLLVLHKWSLKHYFGYIIMRIKNFFYDTH